jgi:hypothetical protein
MNAVAASRIFSVLRYFAHLAQVQLPHQVLFSSHLNLSRENSFIRNSLLSDNHYVFGFIVEGIPIDILWDDLQRLTNPILVVNILHMLYIPKFKKRQL